MAKARQQALAVAPEPMVIPCCDCMHWHPSAVGSAFGHCMQSRRNLQGPMLTTDMTTCSKAQLPPS